MYDHCRLLLNAAKPLQDHRSKGLMNRHKIKGWGYDCSIHYFYATGEVKTEQVSDIETALDYDPFAKKFAELSSQGWELVQTHHVTEQTDLGTGFNMSSQIAYFKKQCTS